MRLAVLAFCGASLFAQGVNVDWNRVVRESRTTATLQVVVNPPLRRGSPIHDRTFAELRNLGADYVRYVPWLPYPRLAVAELRAPDAGETYWDFSLIDPMTVDFLHATEGHPVILNFSTIPAWMFKTPLPVEYPDDPDQPVWKYTQGTELRDPTMRELGEYYARLVSWYTLGGFTDELGMRHESGHHFKIDYWEVLNEVDFEHDMTPEQYTERYDAIVAAIRKVAPRMQFVGLALAEPGRDPRMFEYFLNPKNHQPGIPLDMISYHFYATPAAAETPDHWQYTFFDQADRFLATARYIDLIRRRLSPATKADVDEIGAILPGDPGKVGEPPPYIPNRYWNAAGAAFAYVYAGLAQMGVEIAGESQLVGYPGQFPSVTLIDWRDGRPNARYWILKLLIDHFHPGDRLAATEVSGDSVFAQGAVTPAGRALLLINRRNHAVEVGLPPGAASAEVVDEATGHGPARAAVPASDSLGLAPFAVAVVVWR